MEIKGRIILIGEKRTGSNARGDWANQSYVLETVGEYPEKLVFEVFGEDKISAANISVGDEVSVIINFKAHEYNGRWFNSLMAYRVENETKKQNPEQAHAAQQRQQPSAAPQQSAPTTADTSADDLPF